MNLSSVRFDASGNYLYLPQSDANVGQIVWTSPTRVIAFVNNNDTTSEDKYLTTQCYGQQKYDVVLQKCVTAAACTAAGRFI